MLPRTLALLLSLSLSSIGHAAEQTLRIGDKLKVSFFERLEVPGGSPQVASSSKSDTLLSIYPRTDLSGEFSIDAEGFISVPVFGSIEAQNLVASKLVARLTSQFQDLFGRSSYVTVSVVQRAPVYVLGPIRNPGSFAYQPGLTVLQALALAGGVSDQMQIAHLVEVAREQERLASARDRLKRLLAQRQTLSTGQDAAQAIEPSSELLQLCRREEALELIAKEAVIVRLEGQRDANARAARLSGIEALEAELTLLRQRTAAFDGQLGARAERLRTIEALFARQVVEHQRLGEARSEYFDLLARRKDLDVAVLQSEQKLDQAKRALDLSDLERKATLERRISVADAELRQVRQTVAALEKTVGLMERSATQLLPTDLTASFEIVRMTSGGPLSVQAAASDGMQPGDVLRVGIRGVRPADPKLATR